MNNFSCILHIRREIINDFVFNVDFPSAKIEFLITST